MVKELYGKQSSCSSNRLFQLEKLFKMDNYTTLILESQDVLSKLADELITLSNRSRAILYDILEILDICTSLSLCFLSLEFIYLGFK